MWGHVHDGQRRAVVCFFLTSRRRHTSFDCDWSSTCALPISNGRGIPLKPIDAARVIALRHVKRSDVGEIAGKVFFETCGVGLDADMFGAARLAERGRWGPDRKSVV